MGTVDGGRTAGGAALPRASSVGVGESAAISSAIVSAVDGASVAVLVCTRSMRMKSAV